jgi:hypothetical protein
MIRSMETSNPSRALTAFSSLAIWSRTSHGLPAALQIIASRIAGQLTHETKGEHELHQGLRSRRRSETGKDGQIDAPDSGLRVLHFACNPLVFHSDELKGFPITH